MHRVSLMSSGSDSMTPQLGRFLVPRLLVLFSSAAMTLRRQRTTADLSCRGFIFRMCHLPDGIIFLTCQCDVISSSTLRTITAVYEADLSSRGFLLDRPIASLRSRCTLKTVTRAGSYSAARAKKASSRYVANDGFRRPQAACVEQAERAPGSRCSHQSKSELASSRVKEPGSFLSRFPARLRSSMFRCRFDALAAPPLRPPDLMVPWEYAGAP